MKVCANPDCRNEFSEESSYGEFCFRCKISSVRFNWVGGGGYGRKAFNAHTITSRRAEIEAGAKRDGRPVRPKPVRAELI